MLFQVINASFAHNSWRFIIENLHLLNKILQWYNNHSPPLSLRPSESGRLEFGEFVQLAAKFIVEEDAEAMQKELREAFRLYDKQGNGFIPTTCLKEILKELDDQLTEQELDIMIEEIDSDGSGTVDFDGELALFTQSPLPTMVISISMRTHKSTHTYVCVCVYRSHVCVVHSSGLLKVSHVNISAPPTHEL